MDGGTDIIKADPDQLHIIFIHTAELNQADLKYTKVVNRGASLKPNSSEQAYDHKKLGRNLGTGCIVLHPSPNFLTTM